MFNNTKYTIWYNHIIIQAKNQPRQKGQGTYYENHHVIPKSLGGTNDKNNLVLLTAKEHYICHLLLPKMCIDSKHRGKMTYAFMRLSGTSNQFSAPHAYTSKLYERFKIAYVENISGKHSYMYGIPKSDEIKRKISETRIKEGTGAGENNPMYNKTHSDKSKQNMSKNSKGTNTGEDNGMYGKSRPDLSQYNKEHNIKYQIGQYDADMNLIATYPHASIAAEAIGANTHRNINYLAKNYLKYPNRTAYGFKWRYVT